jgi:hypothetical protein
MNDKQRAYELMLQAVNNDEPVKLKCPNQKIAQSIRFKFYGYRQKLLKANDPNSDALQGLFFSIYPTNEGVIHILEINRSGGNLESLLEGVEILGTETAPIVIVDDEVEAEKLLHMADKAKGVDK